MRRPVKQSKNPSQPPATSNQISDGSIEVIISQYSRQLHALAFSIVKSRSDAEEVVQDSLLKACRALPYFRGQAALTTWLHRIVVNTALNKLRHERTWHQIISLDNMLNVNLVRKVRNQKDSAAKQPFYQLSNYEFKRLLLKELHQLPPVSARTVYLRYICDLSYNAIARQQNCSIGTVKSRLARARQRLSENLKKFL